MVVVAADLHVGSTVAICPPDVRLPDGNYVQLNEVQKWLWSCWCDAWRQIWQMKRNLKAHLYLVLNGDLVEGDHHDTYQLMTRNEGWMVQTAAHLLRGPAKLADDLFVVEGTFAHVGQQGGLDGQVGYLLDAHTDPRGRYSWAHLLLMTDNDVLFDFRHHGSMGQLPHTRSNALNRILMEVVWARTQQGQRPPDVIVRSHTHRYADTGDNYKAQAFSTPCWKVTDDYVHQLPYEPLVHIGLLVSIMYRRRVETFWLGRNRYEPRPLVPWRRYASTH